MMTKNRLAHLAPPGKLATPHADQLWTRYEHALTQSLETLFNTLHRLYTTHQIEFLHTFPKVRRGVGYESLCFHVGWVPDPTQNQRLVYSRGRERLWWWRGHEIQTAFWRQAADEGYDYGVELSDREWEYTPPEETTSTKVSLDRLLKGTVREIRTGEQGQYRRAVDHLIRSHDLLARYRIDLEKKAQREEDRLTALQQ